MTEIKYATMNDYSLLASKDSHIRKEEWKKLIENNQALLFYIDGDFAGWLRWNLFWDEIPFMNMLYFLKEYRGKGYGTQMVEFWESEMVKLGYRDAGGFFPFCNDLEIIFTKELKTKMQMQTFRSFNRG